MRRLPKHESRQRWAEARDLWNEWDPIGIMDDPECPRDEYEAYIGRSLRLLEQSAGHEALVSYLRSVCETIGVPAREPERFADRLEGWYRSGWSRTQA